MDYFGCDLDRKAYEMRSLKIDPAHREGEADLVQSRWFDYSRLLPAQATYLFAHHYKEQTRRFVEEFIDIRTAEKFRAFTPNDIFMGRDMTAMWLARRIPDKYGIPYEFAMRFAQKRAIERAYHRLPRPNQLYGEEYELDLRDAWNDALTWALRYSREPNFKASASTGSPVQKRHQAFVIGQIKSRPTPHHNLLGRMFHEDVLNPQMAADEFPEDTLPRAIAAAVLLDAQS